MHTRATELSADERSGQQRGSMIPAGSVATGQSAPKPDKIDQGAPDCARTPRATQNRKGWCAEWLADSHPPHDAGRGLRLITADWCCTLLRQETVGVKQASLLGELVELTTLLDQRRRRVELRHAALVEHDDSIRVDDRVDAVRNRDDRAV